MSKWYVENPTFLKEIEVEVENNFSSLRVILNDQKIFIRGRLDVYEQDILYDTYGISIELSDDHPKTLPRVYETGGRIPQKAKRHINEDGSACLFVPFERKIFWPNPRSIGAFIGGPVNAYFYSQSFFKKNGSYPFGERSHGIWGVFESVRDLSGMNNLGQALTVIDLLRKNELKGHWPCPCQSSLLLRQCHLEKIKLLKEMIGCNDIKVIANMVDDLKNQLAEKQRRENQLLHQLASGIQSPT